MLLPVLPEAGQGEHLRTSQESPAERGPGARASQTGLQVQFALTSAAYGIDSVFVRLLSLFRDWTSIQSATGLF